MLRAVVTTGLVWLSSCACTEPMTEPPVALVTVTNVNVTLGTELRLDGSRSHDPLGDAVTFEWAVAERPDGANAELTSAAQPVARLRPDAAGTWRVQLIVRAGDRESAPATVRLNVQPVDGTNHAPTAHFIVDTSTRGLVLLDASGSNDADGDSLSYRWRVVEAPTDAELLLRPDNFVRVSSYVTTPGDYRFELTVDDGRGGSDVTTATRRLTWPEDGGVDAGPTWTDGGFTTAGAMNPDEVYLLGTLTEGLCLSDAFAHWSTPDLAGVGAPCDFDRRGAVIHPVDGLLRYTVPAGGELRALVCDACPYAGTYPQNASVNDPVVTTACGAGPLEAFRLAPDGTVLAKCRATNDWRAPGVSAVFSAVHSVGDGVVLTGTTVEDLRNSTSVAYTLPGTVLTSRWRASEDAFVVVVENTATELWKVSRLGVTTLSGTYAPVPGSVFPPLLYSTRLDAAGNLFQISHDREDALVDVIVRRDINGGAAVVYDERTNPLVKIHISALVTGP